MSEKDLARGLKQGEEDAKAAAAAVSLWLPQFEAEQKKKQQQAKGRGGDGGAENSGGGGHSAGGSGGHSQNAGAGAGGSGGVGGGWGGNSSGRRGGAIPEPDVPSHPQTPDNQHHHDHRHDHHQHQPEDRPQVPAKKPLQYKPRVKSSDPLDGVYSDRMRDKIKIEAAAGASESAKDSEILKIAQPISSDDKWLIEKSFSQQFLNSRLNSGHTLPSSHYERTNIDHRIAELNRSKPYQTENQKPANEKSFVAPQSELAKDLPMRSAGADVSASALPSSSAPAAPTAPAKARDGGREM